MSSVGNPPTWCLPFTDEDESVTVGWSRLDNRRQLQDRLGLPPTATDNELFDQAWRRWGQNAPERLRGAFSFARLEPGSRRLILVRDPLGIRPLYVRHTKSTTSASSTPAWFWRLHRQDLKPDPTWLQRYAAGMQRRYEQPPWPSVTAVAPATLATLDLSPTGSLTTHRYHRFETRSPEHSAAPDSDHVQAYREALDEAVRRRVTRSGPIGAHSTGGLDSSTCVGIAAAARKPGEPPILTYGLTGYRDERSFMSLTANMHGLPPTRIFSHDSFKDLDRRETRSELLQSLGFPQNDPSGPSHDPYHAWCREHGLRTLLSGFGGDQGVTSFAWLALAELANARDPRLVRSAFSRRAVHGLRTAVSTVRRSPGFDSDELARVAQVHRDRAAMLPLRGTGTGSRPSPLALRAAASTANEAVVARLEDVAARLTSMALAAHHRGLDYRFPLLDTDLIDTYLRTPLTERRNHGMGRWLHRRAVAGVVPDAIRWQVNKVMGPPLFSTDGGQSTHRLRFDFLDSPHPLIAEIFDVESLRTESGRQVTTSLPAYHHTEMLDRIDHLNLWLSTDPG